MPENFLPRVDSRSSELDHLAASRAWNKARCPLCPGLRTPSLHSNCRLPSEAIRIPIKGQFKDSCWELGSSSTESSPADEKGGTLLNNCCRLPSEALRIPIKGQVKDSCWELGSSSTESSPADEKGGTLLKEQFALKLTKVVVRGSVQGRSTFSFDAHRCFYCENIKWKLDCRCRSQDCLSAPLSAKKFALANHRALGEGGPSEIQGAGKRSRAESSKHFGVRYRPDLSKWVAEIRVAQWKTVDKKVWLGTFETEEGAARAVDSARKILKCKKKRAYNFPCDKLDAYSVEIPQHVAVDDLHNDAMYKFVTSFVKKKSQEYAADFSPNPTVVQPLSLDDIPTDMPGANEFQSLLHELPTLDDISPAAIKQMASPESQIVDDVYGEENKPSDFDFDEQYLVAFNGRRGLESSDVAVQRELTHQLFFNEEFPDFEIDDLFEDPSCVKPFQGTHRQWCAAIMETPLSKKAKHETASNIESLSWPDYPTELTTMAMRYSAREEGELADQASKIQQRPHASTSSLWAGGEYQQFGHCTLVDTYLDDLEDLQECWQTTTANVEMYSCSSHEEPEVSDHLAPRGYDSCTMAMDLGPSSERSDPLSSGSTSQFHGHCSYPNPQEGSRSYREHPCFLDTAFGCHQDYAPFQG